MKHLKTFETFSEVESVEEAKVYGNVYIEDALDSAENAFWDSIASSFPEATSGDLSPTEYFNLRKAMKASVEKWLKNNA
jgi:hypothetical protein